MLWRIVSTTVHYTTEHNNGGPVPLNIALQIQDVLRSGLICFGKKKNEAKTAVWPAAAVLGRTVLNTAAMVIAVMSKV